MPSVVRVVSYNEVIGLLPTFTRAQLEGLRRAAGGLLQNRSGAVVAEGVEHEDWLLRGVLLELERRGILTQNAAKFRIKNSKAFNGYATRAEEVKALLEQHLPGLTSVEKRLLGEIAGAELARYISGWIDVNLSTMLRHIGQVPDAFEKSFPGYLAAGMMWVVINRR